MSDLWYLTYEELLSACRSELSDREKQLIETRKAYRPTVEAYWRQLSTWLIVEDENAEGLQGVSGRSGTAVGKACVINNKREFSRLQKGDILICPFTVISLSFSEHIVVFLGATKLIKADTSSYLRALAFGIPFLSVGLTLNNQLRFEGKAFYGMFGIGLGGVLNVILDPFFIFGLHMGVKGAGVATALSQILCFAFLLYLNKKGQSMPLILKQCQFQKKIIVPLIGGGMPNFCRQAIAAFAIVNRLVMMMGVVMIGFGQGFQPVCAYNYGAGKNDRVRKAFILGWVIIIPLILILPKIIGFLGLSLIQPLSDIGTFCISLPWTISSLKS